MAASLKGHPCTGPLFISPFLASPSEDKTSRRCFRQNTNLKLIDVLLCFCIFRQRPSFRAENYAFEKVRNIISMRTAFFIQTYTCMRFFDSRNFRKLLVSGFNYNLLTFLYFLNCTRNTDFDAFVRPKLNRTTGLYDDISNRHSYPVPVVFFFQTPVFTA
jgi:hypothetical protein